MRLALVALLVSSVALADPPADAPTQEPRTLLFPDGGKCENAAAVKVESSQKAGAMTAVGVIGLAVGLAVGVFVVSPLMKKP